MNLQFLFLYSDFSSFLFWLLNILQEAEQEEKRQNRRIEKKQKRFDAKQKGKKGPGQKNDTEKSPKKVSEGKAGKNENRKRKVVRISLINPLIFVFIAEQFVYLDVCGIYNCYRRICPSQCTSSTSYIIGNNTIFYSHRKSRMILKYLRYQILKDHPLLDLRNHLLLQGRRDLHPQVLKDHHPQGIKEQNLQPKSPK